MKQSLEGNSLYYFRLDFGIFSRYTNSFNFKEPLPTREEQAVMVQLFLKNDEIAELFKKYGLTDFELCRDEDIQKE